MNNDAILASISKIHAYRYAKEKQREIKLGFEQETTTSLSNKFVSLPIPIGTSDFSLEIYGNSYGSYTNKAPYIYSQNEVSTYAKGFLSIYQTEAEAGGIEWVIFEKPQEGADTADSINVKYKPEDPFRKFHFIITRQGTTIKVYIDGELKATKEQSAIKDLGDIKFGINNSSDVALFRVWNYALSADEITTLYNNGDPLGYVVPKLYKQFGPSIEPTVDTFEFNIDSSQFQVVVAQQKYPYDCIYRIDYIVDEWDYQPDRYNIVGFNGVGEASIIGGNYLWYSLSQAKIGEVQSCLVKMPSVEKPGVWIFGGEKTDTTTARRLKVTIKGITPVGCIAEYVAPNLIATKKGPQIEPVAKSFEFNVGSSYYQEVILRQRYPFDCIYKVDYVVEEWDFQPKVTYTIGFRGISGASIISGDYNWKDIEAAKIGELQSFFIKMPKTGTPLLNIYGDQDTEETTARHLKVTIKSITPVSVASTWLDSAKQLPWSDAYLPPLLQSKGEYDMTANGAPEVLFNE